MITSYDKMPIGIYNDLMEVLKENPEDMNEILLSIVSGIDVEELRKMPIPKFRAMMDKLEFLKHQPKPSKIRKEYIVGDYILRPTLDVRKITAGQYIDAQEYANRAQEHLPEWLSCILIPRGMTYGEGYDQFDVIEAIRKHLPITDAMSLTAFFLTRYEESTLPTLISSALTIAMSRQRTAEKRAAKKEALRVLWKAIKASAGLEQSRLSLTLPTALRMPSRTLESTNF